jgi:hypothetical protein
MVITSVRKEQTSSKIAAVYIGSPRLRLLCGEIVVAMDAMVEQAIHHSPSSPLRDSLISRMLWLAFAQIENVCL